MSDRPQWEDCKVCGGDHWTKDHPGAGTDDLVDRIARLRTLQPGETPYGTLVWREDVLAAIRLAARLRSEPIAKTEEREARDG